MGRHSDDSRMVTVWMREELIALLEGARWRVRRNRSQFIREAIAEKMATLGIEVTPDLIYGDEYVSDPLDLRVAEGHDDEPGAAGPYRPAARKPAKKKAGGKKAPKRKR